MKVRIKALSEQAFDVPIGAGALSEQAFDVPIGAGLAVIPPRLLVQGEPRTMPLARKHKLRLLRLRQGVASTG